MHIHIKPIDGVPLPLPKKRRKRKNKDVYPTMQGSSGDDGYSDNMPPDIKDNILQNRSPNSSSEDDDDEIIFVGEQMGPPRGDGFPGLGGQGQMFGPGGHGGRGDLGHQNPFSGMGNFSRGADPLALLASANRFSLQDNMMGGLGGSFNSFSDPLSIREAALLNSRFGDLRGGPGQGGGFDDRFAMGNFNQQQQQRDRDNFSAQGDMSDRSASVGLGGNSNNMNSDSLPGSGGGSNSSNNQNNDNRSSQLPPHMRGMGPGMGGLPSMAGMAGMMGHGGQGGLSGLMNKIKQEPMDYFPSSCHGGQDQFPGMPGSSSGGGFLTPQHLLNSHLRGQLPSLNVPLIRDHFGQHQMLPPHSSSGGGSGGSGSSASSTPTPNLLPTIPASTSVSGSSGGGGGGGSGLPSSSTPSSLPPLPMGLYHQSHFSSSQRVGSGVHPSPATTPSSQMSIGGNIPSNLSTQGARSPMEQEDLRCFSPLRN